MKIMVLTITNSMYVFILVHHITKLAYVSSLASPGCYLSNLHLLLYPLHLPLIFMELINRVAVSCPLRCNLSYYKASNNIVVDLFFVGEII